MYGKLQGKYPARWLTHEEAYDVLLGVCDSSDVGRRDELVLRLGLAGMRVAEIIRLRVGDLHLDHDPTIEWIGKKNRARKVAIGPGMSELLANYLHRYRAGVGRELIPNDFVVCRQKTGGGVGTISWAAPSRRRLASPRWSASEPRRRDSVT